MANISSAHGTLLLDGGWTQEDIDAFIPVLNCWSFYGEYGIQSYDRIPTADDPKTDFSGHGRWSFSSTLKSFHDSTLNWIKNCNEPLSQEQYGQFLRRMEERKLSIIVEFNDADEDPTVDEIDETGAFSVDKGNLVYAPLLFVIREGVLTKYQGFGEDVVIPENVTEIGEYAFYECEGLTSVMIPEGVIKIGEYAFAYCGGLTSVTIPKSVTEIGENAFASCSGLTSVTIPESVMEIADEAFYSCTRLTSVTIPEGVKKIGEFTFCRCESLTNVTIPKDVKKIGKHAFSDCTYLQSVTILAKLEKIDKSVFKNVNSVLIAPQIPISGIPKENKPGALRGFAKMYFENMEIDEEVRAGYLKYIKSQRKKLYPLAVQHEELLRLMLAEKMLARKDVDSLLAECDNQNNETAKAAVLDYMNTL